MYVLVNHCYKFPEQHPIINFINNMLFIYYRFQLIQYFVRHDLPLIKFLLSVSQLVSNKTS